MGGRMVFRFDQLGEARRLVDNRWDSVLGLLGGKGANLAAMVELGLPVPPGFTVTTKACNEFAASGGVLPDGLMDEVASALAATEASSNKVFGDPKRPLLLSVRSGAKFSMPGMMDTVLNIGLNDDIVAGYVDGGGDRRFILDCQRRLIQMFGGVVLGVPSERFETVLLNHRITNAVEVDSELSADALASIIGEFRALIANTGSDGVPDDPHDQLRMAIEAVFASWESKRAYDYRRASGIADDLGTAVNIMAMVFGNTGPGSATGVAMSRDATTGEPRLEGDYLMNAQGEDVVAGIRPTLAISQLSTDLPVVADEFSKIARTLEQHYRDMQDMEFTVEDGKLWILQTRAGKRTAQAAVRIAVDLAEQGLISKQEAVLRVSADQIDFFLHPQFSAPALGRSDPLTVGLNVSPGAAVGAIAFDPDLAERWASDGRAVILVRHETKPDDVHGMLAANGILTSSGGRTSHAALVARQFGRPAVVGASELDIDMSVRCMTVGGQHLCEGDTVSVDGTSGRVYAGSIDTVDPDIDNIWLSKLLAWADEFRTLGVRANADDPIEAERARQYGAAGIGLCRTEHMFFAPERLPIVQQMITAPTTVERREAVEALLPFQRNDFVGLFRAMDGLPVIIRLLDPPMHEFLPSFSELTRSLADLQIRLVKAQDLNTVERLVDELSGVKSMLSRVEQLNESNPMLGLRGIRLGLQIPELITMQTRAITEAALEVQAEGIGVRPEIMVPLVSHASEMAQARSLIEHEMGQIFAERGSRIEIPIGTMIEVPRAALTAAAIAEHADFFSFGTNDLTQLTMGMSRDDAEVGYLLDYMAKKIVTSNPFHSLDGEGVGRLMEIAISDADNVEVGVCGEHGGDPLSIEAFHRLGVDYVSCSAYRVPVARLAAAHAALKDLV